MPARILIADDHEMMRRGLRSLLESCRDYEILEACNGREAVEKARDTRPNLVILDISMPILDGFTAATQIQKLTPGVAILFLSFLKTETFADVARKIGVDGYLTKGDDSATLLRTIDDAVSGNRAKEQSVAASFTAANK
jgi:DNA-binding NarL/FixJ family response regulator